jgi:hypothetical protein
MSLVSFAGRMTYQLILLHLSAISRQALAEELMLHHAGLRFTQTPFLFTIRDVFMPAFQPLLLCQPAQHRYAL